MQPHQFTYPEQSQIYQRLYSLVSPGAASFYKDACRLMDMDTPLDSTTHLVGHLLREIESSLRDVLRPISNDFDKQENSDGGQHKKEILAILTILELTESEVGEIWLRLRKDGLQKYTHRRGLDSPRILDEEFKLFWFRFQKLLKIVLDKFEAQASKVWTKLDELIVKPKPTEDDIDFIKNKMPSSSFVRGYFFNSLESSAWLKPLHKAGFFKDPPGLEINAELKTVRLPAWAQSRYLIKVAPYEPQTVLEIAIQLFDRDSNNIRIYGDLAEAALKMPPELAALWVERAMVWLKTQTNLNYRLPNILGKLISYLAHENQVDVAINLTRELLVVLPPTDISSLRRPITRLDEYYYHKITKEHVAVLVEQKPDVVLTLLCDLLGQYLNFSYSDREERFSEDYSSSWFPTPDSSSENPHGIDSILAGAIWSVTTQIVDRDSNQKRSLFQKFQGYRWRIFDRISLHLLRRFPGQLSDLIIDRLANRDRLEWLEGWFNYSYEHACLLKEQFANLPVEVQKQIFQWIEEGPEITVEINEDERNKCIKLWQRDWLSIISNDLPPNLKQRYTQLVQELGAAKPLDSIDVGNTGRALSTSPKSGTELAEMAEGDMNELFTYLKKWQPSGNLYEASKTGLASELAEHVITHKPQQFVNQIERFKELDTPCMVELIWGLKKALNNSSNEQSAFSWEPVFAFCAWMLKDSRDISKSPDLDSHFERICHPIVEVIDAGLSAKGASRIPLTFRKQVWQLLESLISNPLVSPGFTPQHMGNSMGSYGASVNTVRGKAMHAIVRYAFWIRQDTNGDLEASQNFEDMPEVQQVLEGHLGLQQDPSSAIRAIYGRWFPYLLHLASDWTLQRVDHIFPEEPDLQWLFEAAWEGYMFNQLFTNSFNALRRKYLYAIAQLPTVDTSSREQSETSRALSTHLLDLFWYALIDLGESDNLLEDFFAKAPPHPREEFMRKLSWRLLYGDFKVDDQLCQRLQIFLDWRIGQAKDSATNSDLKYFGWIFASGKLGDQWAIAKLVAVLKLLGTVDSSTEVLKHLENLAPLMHQEVVQCLYLMLNGNEATEWFDSYYRDHHIVILRTALESGSEDVQKLGRDLINRLLARNLGDYRELLP
jgi:hypothetical protein